jgi:phosphopantothenoylcysteine decarboxylase/phosphopantothenate--cysteine ligase
MARLLLGVSGGIAAYKALELVRLATKAGHAVRVVQTEASQRFVGASSFAGLTGAPVLVSEWERDPMRGAFPGQEVPGHDPLSHLELVRNADAFLVAPASANTVAKLAHGLADSLLTACALAATCPVLVAPAMNDAMYEHPATRANLATLRARGIHVLDPGVGALGSKHEWGVGRLPEPAELLAAVEAVVPSGTPRPWDGLRVLVTAGGTREPIDAVRFVGNRSSGRMGFALAEEAAALGADVTVVAANVALARHPRVRYVEVETAAQLEAACRAAFPECDVLLMAAAVADFRPAEAAGHKLKKAGRTSSWWPWSRPRTSSAAWRPSARRARSSSASPPRRGPGATAYGARSSPQGPGRRGGQRRRGARDRLREPRERGHRHHRRAEQLVPRGAKATSRASSCPRWTACAPTWEAGRDDDARAAARPRRARRDRATTSWARSLQAAVHGAAEVRDDVLADLLTCIVAEGHVLIEDLPGVGKTTLARSLAKATGLQFARIQCTADLLPADVVGTNVYNRREERFEFRPGPIFANVVLVDEVNRASPKTQSGLLECMQERRVTVDVFSHELARPFVVLATQNPVEFEGTYPLPRRRSTASWRASRSATRPPRRRRRCCAPTRRATGWTGWSPWATPGTCSPPRTPRAGSTRPTRCAPTSSRCSRARATTPARSSGRRRAPGSCCCAPRRPAPSCRAATMPCLTTSRRSPGPS